jgi:starch synthase
VLFAAAELAPWTKTGGLAEVAAALPAALRAAGVDVRVLAPAYPEVKAALQGARTVVEIAVAAGAFPPSALLAGHTAEGVPLLALDCPDLFERKGDPYRDASGADWPDNHLRFGLLSWIAARIAEGVPGLQWRPDILHCNDWHTGLAPAYLHFAGGAGRARSLFTIHNIAYQGVFPPDVLGSLALPAESFNMDGIEFYGNVCFMKAGIRYADRLNTVSPTHAKEIQSEALGFGLDGLLRYRADDLSGILNGFDVRIWDPSADPHLVQPYDRDSLEAKSANKRALQRQLGLPVTDALPLFGAISRLTDQKGLDLLLPVAADVMNLPAQIVLLGSGDRMLERRFMELARTHSDACAVTIGYDEALAHQIEAGADAFLMPSRYEPCGLNQLYSLRYGAPPVARQTGGIADTVVDCTPVTLADGSGNGFLFDDATPEAFWSAIQRAAACWRDRRQWRQLQANGMCLDFSWQAGSRQYLDLYRQLKTAGSRS